MHGTAYLYRIAAGHRGNARAGQLANAVRLQQLDHRVDLLRIADDLNDHRSCADIDDGRPERFDDAENFRTDGGSALTLISASSRATIGFALRSTTLMTSISLYNCLLTCSSVLSSPVVTMTMRDKPGFLGLVPTVMLSILKPRRPNKPDTRCRTPGWSLTRMDIVCLFHSASPINISSIVLPCVTIGYTFSSLRTTNSTTAGPGMIQRFLPCCRASSLFVARKPLTPYASANLTKSGLPARSIWL